MKKVFGILLAVLVMMTSVALAELPGDTVVVSISITNPNGATSASIGFRYNTDVLQYVGAQVTYGGMSMAPGGANGSFVVMNLSGLTAKEVGKLTFKVKEDAAPGTYAITPVLKEAIDINEQPIGSMGLRGGSVTVECKHHWDEGVTTPATCVTPSTTLYTCTVPNCGQTKTETGAVSIVHTWNQGVETTAPTCCDAGVKTFTCTVENCGQTKTEAILATGNHVYDNGTVTTAPTCCDAGVKTFKCTTTGCTASYTESIDATGNHVYDNGTVTTAPTCCDTGVKTFKCTTAGCTASYTESVPVVEHPYKTIDSKNPTCTEAGYRVLKCAECGYEMTQIRGARGHQYTAWTVIQSAGENTAAKEQRICEVCDHAQTREIAELVDYSGSAFASGIYFRDVTENVTELSEMFVVIDLSVDGETTFELVAGDAYVIGTVTVTVAEGNVTVAYELVNEEIKLNNAFLTFLTDLAAVTTLEKDQLTAYDFEQPISINDQLNGCTTLMLYVDLSVEFSNDTVGLYQFEMSKEYKNMVENTLEIFGIEK